MTPSLFTPETGDLAHSIHCADGGGCSALELVRQELGELCNSAAFQSSRKSCEFLRFIVQRTLEGATDSLKERVIAVELLHRDPSYDAGSDSVVRVRANEVRRRLRSHYSSRSGTAAVQIDVPVGSYVPQFRFAVRDEMPAATPSISSSSQHLEESITTDDCRQEAKPISLSVLAPPALVALFLCAVCIRWHFLPDDPAAILWNLLIASRTTMVIDGTVTDRKRDTDATGKEPSSRTEQLRVLSPLLAVAARYGVTPLLGTFQDAARFGSTALLVTLQADEPSKATPTGYAASTVSIHCGVPCQLTIRGQTASTVQDLLETLVSTHRVFPAKLAQSMEAYGALRSIRAGNVFACTLPSTHESATDILIPSFFDSEQHAASQ